MHRIKLSNDLVNAKKHENTPSLSELSRLTIKLANLPIKSRNFQNCTPFVQFVFLDITKILSPFSKLHT